MVSWEWISLDILTCCTNAGSMYMESFSLIMQTYMPLLTPNGKSDSIHEPRDTVKRYGP